MVNLFRKYQQAWMIAITVLVIIAFVWLFNGTQLDKISTGQSYRVYGRTLSQTDIDRAARRFQLARALNLYELLHGLVGNAFSQDQALESFVWNSFVLDHESKRLGIAPTDSEVANAIKVLPSLQTNGQFDPTKYQEFLQNMLAPNGFTNAQLEDLVRDDLRLKKLVELVGGTVDVTPAEFRTLYSENYQKMEVSLVRFNLPEFAAAVTPTDEEIKKYFDDRKGTLTTDEKRVVSFAQIDLSDAEKKLTGKDRVDASQKLSDRVGEFTQALLAADGASFEETAKKFGFAVKTTPEFAENEPPADLASVPGAAAAAFKLTVADPNSEPIAAGTGFSVLHLDKVVPKRPLTLEEARPLIVEQIKNERGHNALVAKANETRAKIESALKEGKPFADAVAQAGAKIEAFPAFSIAEPAQGKPDAAEIAGKAVEMKEGSLSEFVSTPDGGLLIHLDKREPVDEAKLAKEQETQLEGLRTFKRFTVFQEWLQLRRQEAKIRSLQPQRQSAEG